MHLDGYRCVRINPADMRKVDRISLSLSLAKVLCCSDELRRNSRLVIKLSLTQSELYRFDLSE